MSSGHPSWHRRDPETDRLFHWSDDCRPEEYAIGRYDVLSAIDPHATALAMAMEQSAATVRIAGFVEPAMLEGWTARVMSAREQPSGPADIIETVEPRVPAFHLVSAIYPGDGPGGCLTRCTVEIAYPLRLLHGRPSQWLNVLVGEIPRLGFIRSLRVTDLQLPAADLPGPRFGVAGLRSALGVPRGPLLCRSMRPAVGLPTGVMAALNEAVLAAGFHLVKDDELQVCPTAAAFRQHVAAMVAARQRAEDRTGERRWYLANLICEPEELPERLAIAVEGGANAVLVAPAIQGFGSLRYVARNAGLPVLAHNSFAEMVTRHPDWCIDDALLARLQRGLGADWVVTPGPFATPHADPRDQSRFVRACHGPLHEHESASTPAAPAMLIVQGGKEPGGLPACTAAVGNLDYMLIVASWIDSHPDGPAAGARAFRDAVDALR